MQFFKDLSWSSFTAGFVAVLVGFTSSIAIVFQAAQAFGATPAQLRRYEAHFLGMRPYVARQLITGIFHSDFRHVLPRVGCRVDVVQTQHDEAVPLSVAEYLVQLIPEAYLHVLPVSGHVPFLTHSELTANTLHDLLAQRMLTP